MHRLARKNSVIIQRRTVARMVARSLIESYCRAKCGRRPQLRHRAVSFRRPLVTRVSLSDNAMAGKGVSGEEIGVLLSFHPTTVNESSFGMTYDRYIIPE